MISKLGRNLATIAWHFGPKGLNGECCDDLSMPEFIALDKASSTRNCSVQAVGKCLGFTKSGATRVVNRLAKKGYIQKLKSHEDGRVCCIEPTDKGLEVLRIADLRYQEQFEELIARLSAASGQEIASIFSKVAEAIKK